MSKTSSLKKHDRPQPAPDSSGAPIYLFNGNALLAEDAAMQLRYFGHRVVVFNDIDKVVAAASEAAPAALVVDIDLRTEILSKVALIAQRKEAGHHRFPIMLISARGSFDVRLASARAGANCFFTRPVDVMALLDQLGTLMVSGEMQPYRILIIGDNAGTAEFYGTMLRGAGMDIRLLDKLTDIFRVLDDYRPELVLMDVCAPACTGADLAKLIRQNSAYLDIPIVFLSDDNNAAEQVDALLSGADNLFVKPVEPEHLVSSLANRAERYRALRGLIMRDSLTGLYNHSAIKEFLGREISSSQRTHNPVALAMIDLDFFKRINDSHGHPVGDQVIRALSKLLQQRLRRGDLIGRYGGEEFAVVLPNTSATAALGVLDQIRTAFFNVRHHSDEGEFTASFSAGVADATNYHDTDTLFRAADAALYEAKRKGRNRIEIG